MKTDSNKITILMADDDEEDCLLTRDALEQSRVMNPIDFVHDGEELMAYLRRQGKYEDVSRPGLILLDLNMPRMSGREALSEIKTDPDLRDIPIIILTTSKDDIDILNSYKLGANSYITKPISFDDLVKIIQTLKTYWFEIVQLPSSK